MDKKTALMLARIIRSSYWGIDHKAIVAIGGDGNYVVKMEAIKAGIDTIVFSTVEQWERFQGRG